MKLLVLFKWIANEPYSLRAGLPLSHAQAKSESASREQVGEWSGPAGRSLCGSIMVYPFPKTRTDLTEHPFCFLITLLLSWTFYFISFLLYVLSVAHINLILLLVSDWFYYFHSPSMVAKVKFPWKKIPLLLKKEKKMVWNRTKKKEAAKMDFNWAEKLLLRFS